MRKIRNRKHWQRLKTLHEQERGKNHPLNIVLDTFAIEQHCRELQAQIFLDKLNLKRISLEHKENVEHLKQTAERNKNNLAVLTSVAAQHKQNIKVTERIKLCATLIAEKEQRLEYMRTHATHNMMSVVKEHDKAAANVQLEFYEKKLNKMKKYMHSDWQPTEDTFWLAQSERLLNLNDS